MSNGRTRKGRRPGVFEPDDRKFDRALETPARPVLLSLRRLPMPVFLWALQSIQNQGQLDKYLGAALQVVQNRSDFVLDTNRKLP